MIRRMRDRMRGRMRTRPGMSGRPSSWCLCRRRIKAFWTASDTGSGTVMGVALIAVAALLMGAVAMGGNVMLCRARARSAADVIAVSAAVSLLDGADADEACLVAVETAEVNGAMLDSCIVDGEDVQVVAGMATQVPVVPRVTYESRAGPVDCGT